MINKSIERRKSEHITICLEEEVEGIDITTGLEKYRFIHNALPEIDYNEIELETTFLKKTISTPFIISSMTGGTEEANNINRNLAIAAENRGWSMGVGSMRAFIEDIRLASSFDIRRYAPTIPIIANIGAVQLNYGFGVEECKRAVDLIEADGLVLHLNSIQEVIQPGGNLNFKNLLQSIERICRNIDIPIGVKEVGWGIDSQVASLLQSIGISFIDVAGAGGTSWSQVEKYRVKSKRKQMLAEVFSGWGNPTAKCIQEIRRDLPNAIIIGSGGIKNGLDAGKSIALGADIVGIGRKLLKTALQSPDEMIKELISFEEQLKLTMFGIGSKDIKDLKSTNRLEEVDK